MKDSHVGSFAVIGLCMLMLAQFAVFASVPDDKSCLILLFLPAVSRCCSALAVTALPSMSTSQYASQNKPTAHLVVLTAMLCLFVILGVVLCGRMGFALLGCLAGYALALCRGYRSLQGMNGLLAMTVALLGAPSTHRSFRASAHTGVGIRVPLRKGTTDCHVGLTASSQ